MAQQLDDKRPVFDHSATPNVGRMPVWIRQRRGGDQLYALSADAVRCNALNTVCEEARCPIRAECWSRGTATFMLLGDTCTRACGFCAVKTGKPDWFDDDEPRRVARAGQGMEQHFLLEHNVETVPALYKSGRKGSDYERSLRLRGEVACLSRVEAKSALMLGLGEHPSEVLSVLRDLRTAGVQRLSLGQYLRPSRYHLPVKAYIAPAQFDESAAAE